jgi:hypothetical protein
MLPLAVLWSCNSHKPVYIYKRLRSVEILVRRNCNTQIILNKGGRVFDVCGIIFLFDTCIYIHIQVIGMNFLINRKNIIIMKTSLHAGAFACALSL